jgi:hypothetical protein
LFLNLAFNLNTTTNRVLQGNSLVNNTIEVYQMSQFFATDVTYNNQQSFACNSEVLGSLNYNPLQETGYLSIKLNKAFGDSLIKWSNGKTIDQFKTSLAGLALKGKASDGSIVSFNLNSENSFLKTYYSKDGLSLNYNFNLSTSLRHHIFIESDRQGSDFASLSKTALASSSDLNNQLLIQNGIGASILVNLGDIKALLANKKNILINKAELYLPIKSSTSNTQSDLPVYYLNMFEADNQGNFILTDGLKNRVYPDLNKIVSSGSGLFFLTEDNLSYKFDITYYIQEYLLGERDLNSFLITPNVIYNSVNYQARTNRTVIDASKASFKIYYSEL